MKGKAKLLLLSGGIDSTTLLYKYSRASTPVVALTIDYGQPNAKEVECAKASCDYLGVAHVVLDIKTLAQSLLTVGDFFDIREDKATLEAREIIFYGLATEIANSLSITTVCVGLFKDGFNKITNSSSINTFNKLLSVTPASKVFFIAPYAHYTKGKVLEEGLQLGVNYANTWTCETRSDKSCGDCSHCLQRVYAFTQLGLGDLLEYIN